MSRVAKDTCYEWRCIETSPDRNWVVIQRTIRVTKMRRIGNDRWADRNERVNVRFDRGCTWMML